MRRRPALAWRRMKRFIIYSHFSPGVFLGGLVRSSGGEMWSLCWLVDGSIIWWRLWWWDRGGRRRDRARRVMGGRVRGRRWGRVAGRWVRGGDGGRMDGIDGWTALRWEEMGAVGAADGVLEGEGGFGSALPEAGEEHEEETELGEEEGGPDAGLREHVHRDAGGEDDGGESEEGEEEEDGPGAEEVAAEGSPGGAEGAANAAVGFGWCRCERGGGAGRAGRCRPRRDRSRDGGWRRRGR